MTWKMLITWEIWVSKFHSAYIGEQDRLYGGAILVTLCMHESWSTYSKRPEILCELSESSKVTDKLNPETAPEWQRQVLYNILIPTPFLLNRPLWVDIGDWFSTTPIFKTWKNPFTAIWSQLFVLSSMSNMSSGVFILSSGLFILPSSSKSSSSSWSLSYSPSATMTKHQGIQHKHAYHIPQTVKHLQERKIPVSLTNPIQTAYLTLWQHVLIPW